MESGDGICRVIVVDWPRPGGRAFVDLDEGGGFVDCHASALFEHEHEVMAAMLPRLIANRDAAIARAAELERNVSAWTALIAQRQEVA